MTANGNGNGDAEDRDYDPAAFQPMPADIYSEIKARVGVTINPMLPGDPIIIMAPHDGQSLVNENTMLLGVRARFHKRILALSLGPKDRLLLVGELERTRAVVAGVVLDMRDIIRDANEPGQTNDVQPLVAIVEKLWKIWKPPELSRPNQTDNEQRQTLEQLREFLKTAGVVEPKPDGE